MDGTLFEEWLHELVRKFEIQGRNVVMIVDNCPAHPEVLGPKAINLQFLPPNIISCTQAMDQEVISYVCFINFLVNQIAIESLVFAVGLHCLKNSLITKIEA